MIAGQSATFPDEQIMFNEEPDYLFGVRPTLGSSIVEQHLALFQRESPQLVQRPLHARRTHRTGAGSCIRQPYLNIAASSGGGGGGLLSNRPSVADGEAALKDARSPQFAAQIGSPAPRFAALCSVPDSRSAARR